MNAIDTPLCRPLHCQITLVAAQVEGRPCRTVRGFHLDQPRATALVEGQNVVARAVSVLRGYPSDFSGQIPPVGVGELAPLEIDYESFAGRPRERLR